MDNFNLFIIQTVGSYEESYFNMACIKIVIIQGKFPIRSMPEFVRVNTGSSTIEAFQVNVSGNQKEMTGYFTTDAFSTITGNSNIEFGYGEDIIGIFSDVDINATILPLNATTSSAAFPDADNAWLETIE